MPRELTNLEVDQFLSRHPDVRQRIDHTDNVDGGRYADTIPPHGIAVKDPSGRYVLVWKDGSARWRFIDLWGMPGWEVEINRPYYVSPDAGLLNSILSVLEERSDSITAIVPWVIGGFIVIEGMRLLRR